MKNESAKWGLLLYAKKSKIMVIDQNWNVENNKFDIDDQQLEVVSSFDYFGSIINTNADCSLEIIRGLGMAWKVMMDLDQI